MLWRQGHLTVAFPRRADEGSREPKQAFLWGSPFMCVTSLEDKSELRTQFATTPPHEATHKYQSRSLMSTATNDQHWPLEMSRLMLLARLGPSLELQPKIGTSKDSEQTNTELRTFL